MTLHSDVNLMNVDCGQCKEKYIKNKSNKVSETETYKAILTGENQCGVMNRIVTGNQTSSSKKDH